MDEERKEKIKENIKFNIFPIVGLLFLPIAAPIMWVSDKIYFRERINFEDVVEAFWIYVLLCLFWGGCVYCLWKLIEACMIINNPINQINFLNKINQIIFIFHSLFIFQTKYY